MAWYYYRNAVALCAGPVLAAHGAWSAPSLALVRRIFWPLALLALPGVFFIWSMHMPAPSRSSCRTSGRSPTTTPVTASRSCPSWPWPSAALVTAVPERMRPSIAVLMIGRRDRAVAGASRARAVGHLGRIARQLRRPPRLDERSRRLAGAPLRSRFRYHHIARATTSSESTVPWAFPSAIPSASATACPGKPRWHGPTSS